MGSGDKETPCNRPQTVLGAMMGAAHRPRPDPSILGETRAQVVRVFSVSWRYHCPPAKVADLEYPPDRVLGMQLKKSLETPRVNLTQTLCAGGLDQRAHVAGGRLDRAVRRPDLGRQCLHPLWF